MIALLWNDVPMVDPRSIFFPGRMLRSRAVDSVAEQRGLGAGTRIVAGRHDLLVQPNTSQLKLGDLGTPKSGRQRFVTVPWRCSPPSRRVNQHSHFRSSSRARLADADIGIDRCTRRCLPRIRRPRRPAGTAKSPLASSRIDWILSAASVQISQSVLSP
jgi:hypothetical protein